MIEATALQALLALEDHQTVAAASRALGYTPSAVSQQLRRLEQQVGAELTQPVGRNLLLTPAGVALAKEGRELLERWSELGRAADSPGTAPTGSISIAAFPTALRGLLIPAIAALHESAPALSVVVSERDITPAIDAVRAGRVDACIVHGWHGLATTVPDDLRSADVGPDRADLVVHADHPLAGRDHAVPADLLEHRWTIQPPGTVCNKWFLHMFAGLGRTPREVWEVGEYGTQLDLVRGLGAIALIPRLGVDLGPDLCRVPVLDPEPVRDLFLVSRSRFHRSPQHTALLAALTEAYAAHTRRAGRESALV